MQLKQTLLNLVIITAALAFGYLPLQPLLQMLTGLIQSRSVVTFVIV